ncbi:MAG: hypothetical protein KIT52_12725 [Anaerolineae bacterium]|nr:hypothetical protein [Anaerolineae bacterium]
MDDGRRQTTGQPHMEEWHADDADITLISAARYVFTAKISALLGENQRTILQRAIPAFPN